MDLVFDAQFRIIKDTFARAGIEIEVAYTPAGDVDYVYQTDRLLTTTANVPQLTEWFGGIRTAPPAEQPPGDLTVLVIDRLERGYSTVPDVLDEIDERLGDNNPARQGRPPTATPNYLLHIARLCSAIEPEVPSGNAPKPWPEICTDAGQGVMIGVCDTGILQNVSHSWLIGVTGDTDPLGPQLPNGQARIDAFTGHGTFVAGVARCMAPQADVFVADHFRLSGAVLETEMIRSLEQLIQAHSPSIVNLSAGTYTRQNWTPLGFESFHQRHPGVTLVAAAGNDSTDREFFPAAFPWAIGVGAVGPDEQHRAWFSNFGNWVDVYAPGEGVINAYATGEYTYQEPPKLPARQNFSGMARWDGTSFSAPLVAGLIAAEMSRTGSPADVAAQAVLGAAQTVQGVGPVLHACQQP